MDTLPHQQILRQQFDHSAEEPLQLKYLIKFGGKVNKYNSYRDNGLKGNITARLAA
jgi:hypothetical protein